MANRLPPFAPTALVTESTREMTMAARKNDEDIKRQLAEALALIEALDARVYALEHP